MSNRNNNNTSNHRVPLGAYEAPVSDPNVTDDLIDMMKSTTITDANDPNVENQIIDWEKERDELDRYFDHQSKEQLKRLPRYIKPKGFKPSTKLLPHQKDGVRWLLGQELDPLPNPNQRTQTLMDGSTIFIDRFTTRCKIPQPYLPVKGAILADEMGLGKTVQALGLILSNLPPATDATSGAVGQRHRCTLVLCPKSVLSVWEMEIKKFVKDDALRTVVFEGTPNQRSKIIEKVVNNEVDLLLATYNRVGSDYGSGRMVNGRGHPLMNLFDTGFYRVILDEAQEIRNPSSKRYKGVMQISKVSLYRVALTGTPLVNNPSDVYSLLSFVGLEPWDDSNTFRTYITTPIREKQRKGLTKLRAALTYVAFRRTKNAVKGLTVPSKTVELVRVNFPKGDHKKVYDHWFNKTKAAFEVAEEEDSALSSQNKFTMQIKLRQSCASGALVVPEGMNDPRFAIPPKIFALMNVIDTLATNEKVVIFSQWNSFLDLVGNELTKEGHKFVRIDGSKDRAARTDAIQALDDDPNVRFILCSLRAGGQGINLLRANVVCMMDPWWNDATEMQAVDRCHRLGQTRLVRVYRFIMKESIEERMVMNIQEAKSKLGKGALAHLTAEELKMAKIVTLKDLFGINAGNGVNEVDDEEYVDWE